MVYLKVLFWNKNSVVNNYLLFLVLSLGLIIPFSLSGQIKWDNGKKAAIVLSYDDGLDSHLNIAIPQLNLFGFKGTFFLYGHIPEERFTDWKNVNGQGHELGNHSLYHPCKGNDGESHSSRFYSENYDVPSIIREIAQMNKLLFAITGEKPTSYAYPCGETVVGGVDYSDSLRQSGLVRFARNGRAPKGINNGDDLNIFKVPGFGVAPGSTSKELINYATEVLKTGGLGIYIFHGVGGDYLSVDAEEHHQLLEFLEEHKNEYWVTTFSDVMKFIQNKK